MWSSPLRLLCTITQALRRNVRLPQRQILGERVVFAIAGPEPQDIERRQPSPRRWPQQQIDRAVDMTEQGAAAIAARFFDDRDQLQHRAASDEISGSVARGAFGTSSFSGQRS